MAIPATSKSKPKTATVKKAPVGAAETGAPVKPDSAAVKTPVAGVETRKAGVVDEAELKKKELVDMVVARTGVKKKYAKPAVEAMIDVLGEAIAEGRKLNLQPLGKIMHQRSKDTANARITIAKIRQSKSAGPALDVADRADVKTSVSPKETVADVTKGR